MLARAPTAREMVDPARSGTPALSADLGNPGAIDRRHGHARITEAEVDAHAMRGIDRERAGLATFGVPDAHPLDVGPAVVDPELGRRTVHPAEGDLAGGPDERH